jgi:hypothetical protein
MPLGFDARNGAETLQNGQWGYREVQYTLEEDGLSGWQWAWFSARPPTIKSGQAVTRGAAIIRVWAANDRVFGSQSSGGCKIGTAHAVILCRNDFRFHD